MTEALILAGHGSHLDPNSSEPIRALADRLGESGGFSEVRTAFWKEEPSLSRAFDGLAAELVTVVPVFMADGYFMTQVIPREMQIAGPVTCRDGMRIRYCGPVGAAPGMVDVLLARALEAGATPASAVAVLGHGTPRNPRSERTVIEQAERLRALGRFREVHALFLDQEPNLRDIRSVAGVGHVVAVPYFVAEGWHAGQQIPAELGGGASGGWLSYAGAVGTHPMVADVIRGMVEGAEHAAESTERRAKSEEPRVGSAAAGAGWHGELRVMEREGVAEVWAPGDGARLLDATRAAVRAAARFDATGMYRPLPGARTLARGWGVACTGGLTAEGAVDSVYPLATSQRALHDGGKLQFVSLDEVLGRQSGRYEIAVALSARGRELAGEVLCARCVKRPLWRGDGCEAGDIPCPEPCSVLVSLCREAALWERQRPGPAARDEQVAWAAFDEPGNEIREAYLRGMAVQQGSEPQHG